MWLTYRNGLGCMCDKWDWDEVAGRISVIPKSNQARSSAGNRNSANSHKSHTQCRHNYALRACVRVRGFSLSSRNCKNHEHRLSVYVCEWEQGTSHALTMINGIRAFFPCISPFIHTRCVFFHHALSIESIHNVFIRSAVTTNWFLYTAFYCWHGTTVRANQRRMHFDIFHLIPRKTGWTKRTSISERKKRVRKKRFNLCMANEKLIKIQIPVETFIKNKFPCAWVRWRRAKVGNWIN